MVRLDKILFISSLGVAPVIAAGYTPSKSPMNASEVINGTGVVTGTAVANSSETKPCIDDATAKALVDKFNYFYININSTLAEKTLTPDFTEWSDSENYSEGNLLPEGTPTTANRTAFIAEQPVGNGTETNAYEVLEVIHSCDTIAYRWEVPKGFDGKGNYTVKGIDFLHLVYQNASWWIQRDYSEWNSIAYLRGIGKCSVCV